MDALYYILLTLFIVLSLFLILLVLIQKGRGGGLSAAFGGVGGNTAFGAKTGDVLTWATSIVFGVFLVLGISLNLLADSIHQDRLRTTATTQPAKTATETGSPANDLMPVTPATQPVEAPTTQPQQ
jgi:preprotein translocase subunit SecG